jgi:hypothetical protein
MTTKHVYIDPFCADGRGWLCCNISRRQPSQQQLLDGSENIDMYSLCNSKENWLINRGFEKPAVAAYYNQSTRWHVYIYKRNARASNWNSIIALFVYPKSLFSFHTYIYNIEYRLYIFAGLIIIFKWNVRFGSIGYYGPAA